MKKIRDTDYLFLSSYLEAKMARQGDTPVNKAEVYKDLDRLAPDPGIVDFFRLKYDYHNAKVCLKSTAMGTENSRLFLPLGRMAPEVIQEAYRSGDYRACPKIFAAALRDSADALGRTADPRLADFVLDKAYVRELKEIAAETGSDFLTDYARLYADALNLKALTRMLKSGVRPELLGDILTDCGSVSPASLMSAYPDTAAVLQRYRATDLAPALGEAERAAGGEGFAPFERAVHRCLTKYMDGGKVSPFGEKVLIRYLYGIEEQSI